MSYGERDTFEATRNKFEAVCAENGLVCKIFNKQYPFSVAVSPYQAMADQISMLDSKTGHNGKEAMWIFIFPDGELDNKTVDNFTMSEKLRKKLSGFAQKLFDQWCHIVFRENIENSKFVDYTVETVENQPVYDDEPEYAEL